MSVMAVSAKMVAPAFLVQPRKACNLNVVVRPDGMGYSAMNPSTNVADSRVTMVELVNQAPVGSGVCVHRAFPDRIVASM